MSRLFGCIRFLKFLVAAALAAAGLSALTAQARAVVPPAQNGIAVVSVFVGGDRNTPTTIAPLPGVTYGVFEAQPMVYDTFNGYTDATDAIYQCTSDGDGHCVFQIPINSSSPVQAGDRLWVAPLYGPAGSSNQWFANPVWQTAPSSGSSKVQTRHVFQTPGLQSGGLYVSGSGGFISDPGTETTPPSGISDYPRRVASGGVWPLSRRDPDLPPQCGLDVALVVDLSGSMNGSVPALKTAMDSFVNSLRGTPSRAALFTFSTNTPAINGPPNTQLLSMASTADSNNFKSIYAAWTNATASGFTNWDAAFNSVASSNAASSPGDLFDLVVFMTDGNPTVYGAGSSSSPSGYTRFREIGNAVASANRLKATGGTIVGTDLIGGTRVLAVGVGSGLDVGTDRNLRSISGRTEYSPSTPIQDVDFFRSADFNVAAQRLRELFLSACAPTVSVVKQVIPFGGTVADAYTPTEQWTFSGTPVSSGLTVNPTSGQTSSTTGAMSFDLDFDQGNAPATIDIAETLKPGYTLVTQGGDNASCVDKSDDDASIPVTNQGATGFRVSLGIESAISCVVYNEAPDPTVSSVQVDKEWELTTSAGTEAFEHGEQPPFLQSEMTLTGPGAAGATFQPWGVPREGYTAPSSTIFDENCTIGLPGCALVGASFRRVGGLSSTPIDLGSPSFGLPVQAGTNEYVVTNHVVCNSYLTLQKQVEGGSINPGWWNLEAIEPAGALPGPTGISGATAEVSDSVTYQLAEEPNAFSDDSVFNYKQIDDRPQPITNPLSTGSMTCNVDAGGGDSTGSDGGVVVPLGQSVTCVAINQASKLKVIKVVKGGNAKPSDFRFRATPIDPDPLGIPVQELEGAASPGSVVNARPEQRYRVTEIAKPGRYRLTGLTCKVNDQSMPAGNIVLNAGERAICRAVNTYRKPVKPKTHARVTVVKKANRNRARHGQRIGYRIVLRSVGKDPARGVRVCDLLPRSLILVRAPGAKVSGGRACWRVNRLDPGKRRVFRVVMRVPRVGVTRRVGNRVRLDGKNVPPGGDVDNVVLVRDPPEPPFTG